MEPLSASQSQRVTVKFAIKNLDTLNDKGELIPYPDIKKEDFENQEDGPILVRPKLIGKPHPFYTMMSNLNSQGGDLRFEGRNIRLFGDGDGYQFTDLVIWDVDEETNRLEGYVRDYGQTYAGNETFKQFIKCKRSTEKL